LRSGRLDDASATVSQALAIAGRTGECWANPVLHMLEGDLALATTRDGAAEAEARFRHAIEVAVDQGARSLVLQGALRLARLLAEQGRRIEARGELAAACDSFEEGFDAPDLKEARALLEALP
jgi:predicted ATPase